MTDEPPSEWAELDRNVALMRRVAADPSTPADTLAHLAQSSEPAVRALVSSNPNAPIDTLQRLADEFPDRFFANPALPLLLIENPQFVQTIPRNTLLLLLRAEGVPAWLVAGEHRVTEVRHAMAMHVQRAGEAGEDWLEEAQPAVASHFPYATFYNLPHFVPPWLLRALVKKRSRNEVVKSPDISPQDLVWLAQSPIWNIYMAVAENPRTPAEGLAYLIQYQSIAVQLRLAQHPNATAEILHDLAAHEVMHIRRAVAYHAHTDRADLISLASDRESIVRRAAAKHPRLDSTIRIALANDINTIVRATVARHPQVSSMVLERLATDGKAKVRIGAAKNPTLPHTILMQLAQDVHPRVRNAARKRLDASAYGTTPSYKQTPLQLAHSPHVSPDLLARLARDEDTRVRAAVAANKAAPVEVLRLLAHDPSTEVLAALARNSHLTFDVLEQIVQEAPWWLFATMAANPSLTKAQRQTIYQHFLRRSVSQHASATLYAGQREALWLLALTTVRHDDSLMTHGASSLSWLERFMVAMNPHAPRNVLEALTHDGNRFVRAAARHNSK